MRRLLRLALHGVLTVLGLIVLWLTVAKLLRRLYPFPAPAILGRYLDSDLRRMLQPPGPILERSGVEEGMSVLEVGCGSGAYTTHIAGAAGDRGRVTALDIQRGMLAQLKEKLNRTENRGVQNVDLCEGSAHELPFREGSVDLVSMITVLPEIPDQERALAAVRRVLKSGGILAVTEFFPDPDYPLSSTTIKRGEQAGFHSEGVCGNLWTYTVRFRKPIEVGEGSA